MPDQEKSASRTGAEVGPGGQSPDAKQAVELPDYVMLDFVEDFLPPEDRRRTSRAAPAPPDFEV